MQQTQQVAPEPVATSTNNSYSNADNDTGGENGSEAQTEIDGEDQAENDTAKEESQTEPGFVTSRFQLPIYPLPYGPVNLPFE